MCSSEILAINLMVIPSQIFDSMVIPKGKLLEHCHVYLLTLHFSPGSETTVQTMLDAENAVLTYSL